MFAKYCRGKKEPRKCVSFEKKKKIIINKLFDTIEKGNRSNNNILRQGTRVKWSRVGDLGERRIPMAEKRWINESSCIHVGFSLLLLSTIFVWGTLRGYGTIAGVEKHRW